MRGSRRPGRFPVDGNEYVDLCLGDTGAMTGHSPAGSVPAIARQLERGLTTMLPTEDAIWVGGELFGEAVRNLLGEER